MKRRAAFTFIGKDRPGIVAGVSQAFFRSGCNIEDTTMTLLENQFAMILIVTIPSLFAEKQLKQRFDKFRRKWGLNYFKKIVSSDWMPGEKHPPGTRTYLITVAGKDRTGIVYETSRIAAAAHLNITDLNSKVVGKGEKSVFLMMLEVDVPKGFQWKRLEPAWKKLKNRLGVDVRLKLLEQLTL